MIHSPEQKIVDAAITSRHSVRAFLPTAVERADLEQILEVAARAPSGTNTQPWKVYVLTGAAKQRLSGRIQQAYADPDVDRVHVREYEYYPNQWTSPYIERRRKVGWDLYALLNLTRDNKEGMHAQHARNYDFFDAPVGLIFTIDRIMEKGSWLDYGMFLENIMIAARGRGLDTCAQAAFTQFHTIISDVCQIPANEMIVCGMALGYADRGKVENSLVTERETLANFVRFLE
jgi:nitroreductase